MMALWLVKSSRSSQEINQHLINNIMAQSDKLIAIVSSKGPLEFQSIQAVSRYQHYDPVTGTLTNDAPSNTFAGEDITDGADALADYPWRSELGQDI